MIYESPEGDVLNALKIAYLLLHFPYLTETFVAEEIRSLRAQGVDVRIVSLLGAGPGPVQPISEELLSCVWCAPGMQSFRLWRAQLRFFFRSPGLYLKLLVQLLSQPLGSSPLLWTAKRVLLFLKGVSVAYHFKDDDVQLLHAHFGSLGGAATWIASQFLRLPYTVTLVAYDIYAAGCKDLLPLVSGQATRVVTISEYNRQYLDSVLACSPKGVTVIPHGIDLGFIPQKPRSHPDCRAGKELRILSVGSLIGKKGHIYLVEACHLLKEQGLPIACSIIGGGPDEAALQRRIDSLGMQHQIKLLGPRPHPEVLDACLHHDLFVLASVVSRGGDRDGIPIVLMEAGAAGLPLISTKVSGIPELVQHGQTGLLVAPGDSKALAKAMAALADDPAECARLGENARALVETKFSVEKNTLRLTAVFRQAIADHSGGPAGQ
jgi:glycosyltransferase involved in cell wall biosynthesis